MTITRFEDIEAWQMARKLCQDIHGICYETGLQKDFGLRDQMSRSSGSIMDNIAEGFDGGSNPEFARFLQYAKRSCSELQSQLCRTQDRGYIDQQAFERLYDAAGKTRGKIGGFIQYLSTTTRPTPSPRSR